MDSTLTSSGVRQVIAVGEEVLDLFERHGVTNEFDQDAILRLARDLRRAAGGALMPPITVTTLTIDGQAVATRKSGG